MRSDLGTWIELLTLWFSPPLFRLWVRKLPIVICPLWPWRLQPADRQNQAEPGFLMALALIFEHHESLSGHLFTSCVRGDV